MFVNRETELAALERMFISGKAEMFVLYGRRRVGKTELLQRFCEGKQSIYFLASQLRDADNLRQMTEIVRHTFKDPLLDTLTFSDWESILVYLAQKASNERLVLVLDEFQYLCEDNRALPSIVQRFWDLHGKKSKLFLILCGSHVSFMEREILAERAPLYGRRTGQQQLQPLSYRDASLFFPTLTPREKLIIYGILGGMPGYLLRFSPEVDIKTNVINEMLQVQGYLYDEVNFLLRMELKESRTYASILQAVASGCSKQSEISNRVGLDVTTVNKYLTVLRELSLVQREAPVTERAPKKSRKGVYSIADNYVRFWFRFVQPYVSFIQAGQGELVFREFIAPNLHQYLGHLFEKACRQYVQLFWQEKLKIAPKRTGRYWNKFCEIDILTENLDGSHLVGECKWSQNPIGEEVLEELISDAHHLPTSFQCQMIYALFSLSGFTEELKQRAEKEGIYLISADEMF